MHTPILSILTPACWERAGQITTLRERIAAQIAKLPRGTVEHLVLLDNRARSVGLKRQALLDAARGEYVAFVDDDDDVSEDYVAQLVAAAATGADCITFLQDAFVDRVHSTVSFGREQADAPFEPGAITRRGVWHVCAIRREHAQRAVFPDLMDGEDRLWCQQVRPLLKTEHHIPQVLHTYRFSSAGTLASGKKECGV